MNKMRILGVIGALAVLGGATLAFQFQEVDSQNIVAKRLPGTWRVDAPLTARLNPAPGAMIPRELVFQNEPMLRDVLVKTYPRYANFDIYMTGTATMNGESHMFALLNEEGNAHLVLFTPGRDDPAIGPHHVHIGIMTSRTSDNDLLYIGGDLVRESAAVYGRVHR